MIFFQICSWIPQDKYDGKTITESYPNVCAEEPEYGKLFCPTHARLVESMDFPSEANGFIQKCKVDPGNYTKDGKQKVKKVLEFLSEKASQGTPDLKTSTPEETQGTAYLLRNRQIANNENSEMAEDYVKENFIKKDIGELRKRIFAWSRGVMLIVGGE